MGIYVKSNKIKHILVTSIIFLIIIAIIVLAYQSQLNNISDDLKESEPRVVVTADIKAGEKLVFGTGGNVELQNMPPVIKAENLATSLDEIGAGIALEPMYKGEIVVKSRVGTESQIYKNGERLYSIKLDSSSTGGYNISEGEYVDICVLYKEGKVMINPIVNDYQNLPKNKLIDVVLAKKLVKDIRDEAGVSVYENAAVKPGYVCFKLSYEQINKLELAKKQGTLFIGKVGDSYMGDAHKETFMEGAELPIITPPEATNTATTGTPSTTGQNTNAQGGLFNNLLP